MYFFVIAKCQFPNSMYWPVPIFQDHNEYSKDLEKGEKREGEG